MWLLVVAFLFACFWGSSCCWIGDLCGELQAVDVASVVTGTGERSGESPGVALLAEFLLAAVGPEFHPLHRITGLGWKGPSRRGGQGCFPPDQVARSLSEQFQGWDTCSATIFCHNRQLLYGLKDFTGKCEGERLSLLEGACGYSIYWCPQVPGNCLKHLNPTQRGFFKYSFS